MFAFYTMWNYLMFTVFFGCVLVATLVYLRRHGWRFPEEASSYDSVDDLEYDLDERDSRFRIAAFVKVTWIMFEIVFSCVFLVDIVVWTILLPFSISQHDEGAIVNFVSFNVHASNVLFVLVEAFFNRIKFAAAHIVFPLLWAMIYMVWAWIYYDFSGSWVYPFVQTDQNSAPAWYLLMLVMHSAFFGMGYGLWLLKERKLIHRHRQNLHKAYNTHASAEYSAAAH